MLNLMIAITAEKKRNEPAPFARNQLLADCEVFLLRSHKALVQVVNASPPWEAFSEGRKRLESMIAELRRLDRGPERGGI